MLAVPLPLLAKAVLCSCPSLLRGDEAAVLRAKEQVPTSFVSPVVALRRGVALLWLESGSWASGIVVSDCGHILTCAHFLTGRSWMEGGAQSQVVSSRPCKGRAQVCDDSGNFKELTFEADVLHVAQVNLDVGLVKVRDSPGRFVTIPWCREPLEGWC